MAKVKMYKVCVPSYLAYPTWKATIEICYTEEKAREYIKNYPNLLIQPLLFIEEYEVETPETD